MNRTPIVGLRKFRFDGRRCGSFVCVRIGGNVTTTGSGTRRRGSSRPAWASISLPAGLRCPCRPRKNGSWNTGPTERTRSWARRANAATTGEKTKVAVARDHVDNDMTKTEVMAKYAIASVAPLERWCREYRTGGPGPCARSPRAGRGARDPVRSPSRRASRSSPRRSPTSGRRSRTSGRRSRTWKECAPCGRGSREARAKRHRAIARRAGGTGSTTC